MIFYNRFIDCLIWSVNNLERYNLYCDESCHLEHDNSDYMILGGIRCPKGERKRLVNDIRNIKLKYELKKTTEIKWQSISPSKINFYLDLVNYFFEEDTLSFRAIIVDKKQINLNENSKFIDFYYKMYFYVLSGLISPNSKNEIYLDKVDSKSAYRIRKLHEVLCNSQYDFNMENISKVQNISSYESELLQLADLFVGAISYKNRNIQTSVTKKMVIDRIIELSGYDLTKSTMFGEGKFNIFKIKLQDKNNVSI